MKYYFPVLIILLLVVIVFSGCVSLPPTGGPECYTDSDCSSYGDNYICDANGDCTACPEPMCAAPPAGCYYEQDNSARCPTCGELKCGGLGGVAGGGSGAEHFCVFVKDCSVLAKDSCVGGCVWFDSSGCVKNVYMNFQCSNGDGSPIGRSECLSRDGCSWVGEVVGVPVVNFLVPDGGSSVRVGDGVLVRVSAVDGDDEVRSVRVFDGDELVFSEFPGEVVEYDKKGNRVVKDTFIFTWVPREERISTLRAVAVDSKGNEGRAEIKVDVKAPISNNFQTNTRIQAKDGDIISPMITDGESVFVEQDYWSNDGGSVSFTFDILETGTYYLNTKVSAPSASSNSLYVGLNLENAAGNADYLWSVPITNGFEEKEVKLSEDSEKHIWSLTKGTHKFIFYGREDYTKLKEVKLVKLSGDAGGDCVNLGGSGCTDTIDSDRGELYLDYPGGPLHSAGYRYCSSISSVYDNCVKCDVGYKWSNNNCVRETCAELGGAGCTDSIDTNNGELYLDYQGGPLHSKGWQYCNSISAKYDNCVKCDTGYTWSEEDKNCVSTVCGNGKLELGEECDDNNLVSGDGCSSECKIEYGFSCSGEPSICQSAPTDYVPAFPGAEGFGARTRGAYALYEKTKDSDDLPIIYHVTSLSGGSGEGTLGKVMRMTVPRLIVFDVGGTIELNGNIPAKSPYITIAGQTAPGEGIMIKNGALTFHESEVIVRGLRILTGDDTTVSFSPSNRDALTVWGYEGSKPTNIILDHNTFMWGSDETVSVGLDVNNITIQYNIIAEGLENSHHPEGPHGKGLLFGDYGESGYYSVHHNIFAFNKDRNPLFNGYVVKGSTEYPFHNEVINNYLYHTERGTRAYADLHFIGNYHDDINTADSHTLNQHTSNPMMGEVYIYVEDNYGPTRKDPSQPEWDILRKVGGVQPNQANEYVFEPSGITTHPSSQVKELLLGPNGAGAIVPSRGENVERMINEIKARQGTFKDCVGSQDQYFPTGNVISANSNSINVELPFSNTENYQGSGYKDKTIKITSGKGSGQVKEIISSSYFDYDNDGKRDEATIEISSSWNTIPDSTSQYAVITDCSRNAGGWKLLPEVNRPSNFDTDKDGMPDNWEDQHGLDKNDASDAHGYDLSDKYHNIEVYINSFFS